MQLQWRSLVQLPVLQLALPQCHLRLRGGECASPKGQEEEKSAALQMSQQQPQKVFHALKAVYHLESHPRQAARRAERPPKAFEPLAQPPVSPLLTCRQLPWELAPPPPELETPPALPAAPGRSPSLQSWLAEEQAQPANQQT